MNRRMILWSAAALALSFFFVLGASNPQPSKALADPAASSMESIESIDPGTTGAIGRLVRETAQREDAYERERRRLKAEITAGWERASCLVTARRVSDCP